MNKLAGGKIHRDLKTREEYDYYPTPDCAVLSLLENEKFDGPIWEPACGDGKIIKVLKSFGYTTVGSDIKNGVNFFSINDKCFNIVTNPPFKLAEDFIKHGHGLVTKKLVLLLRLSFLDGQKRYREVYSTELRPSRVYVISNRLPFYKHGKWSKSGGQFTHAWFVWDKDYKGETVIKWLLPDTSKI